MIHIDYLKLPIAAQKLAGSKYRDTVCGAEIDPLNPAVQLTETALASDCDACRIRLNIGGKNDLGGDRKRVGIRPVPVYTPGDPYLGPGKPVDCDGKHDGKPCGDPFCRIICDECNGSGTYYIDGEPQKCICSEVQS